MGCTSITFDRNLMRRNSNIDTAYVQRDDEVHCGNLYGVTNFVADKYQKFGDLEHIETATGEIEKYQLILYNAGS